MALKWWKEFEDTAFFRRNKLKFKRLIGKEPRLDPEINCSLISIGDWRLPNNAVKEGGVVYSIGVCDDLDFELEMISRYQAELFAFDPTPYSVDWIAQQTLPTNFNFKPWAAAGEDGHFVLYPRIDKHGHASTVMYTFHTVDENRIDGVRVEALTIASMMQRLGHEQIDVLKMDVEGAEYEVLNSLLESQVRPKVIMVEFHHRFKGIGKARTEQTVSDLRRAGYVIAGVSINGREVCFVKRT